MRYVVLVLLLLVSGCSDGVDVWADFPAVRGVYPRQVKSGLSYSEVDILAGCGHLRRGLTNRSKD
jgi:hypothetical protein